MTYRNITMPELTGSEKQIAWANDILAKWLGNVDYMDKQFDDYISRGVAAISVESALGYNKDDVQRVRDNLLQAILSGPTDAHHIIERRNTFSATVLENIAKEYARERKA